MKFLGSSSAIEVQVGSVIISEIGSLIRDEGFYSEILQEMIHFLPLNQNAGELHYSEVRSIVSQLKETVLVFMESVANLGYDVSAFLNDLETTFSSELAEIVVKIQC